MFFADIIQCDANLTPLPESRAPNPAPNPRCTVPCAKKSSIPAGASRSLFAASAARQIDLGRWLDERYGLHYESPHESSGNAAVPAASGGQDARAPKEPERN